MAKVIFVLQRKPGMTREECSRTWAGEQHTSTVSKIPGLTRWVQNHAISLNGARSMISARPLAANSHAAGQLFPLPGAAVVGGGQ
jgi:hypothetical protein